MSVSATPRCRAAVPLCAVLILLPALARAREVEPVEVARQAAASRRRAAEQLAAARRSRIAEREKLAAQLAGEYDRLDTARRALAGAQSALRRLEQDDRAGDTAESLRELADSITVRASRAVGAGRPADDSIDTFEAALMTALERRLGELRAALAIRRGKGAVVGRSGMAATVPVLHLGSFASYACGESAGACGLLRPQAGGNPLIVGPLLAPEQRLLLSRAASGRGTAVPLDLTGALRDRVPAAEGTPRTWLAKGGLFIYPILLVAALGAVLAAERLLYLLATRRPLRVVVEVVPLVQAGKLAEARERAKTARGPTGRILNAAITARDKRDTDLEAAMESALLLEAPRMERSLSLMSALASVAPLLGLLGTVSGMIMTFDTIALAGTGNPRLLSGGISEALITTQLGLMVGIPLLLVHAWLARWVERREAILECDALQAFGLHEREAQGR